jgi:hypothetical protein
LLFSPGTTGDTMTMTATASTTEVVPGFVGFEVGSSPGA